MAKIEVANARKIYMKIASIIEQNRDIIEAVVKSYRSEDTFRGVVVGNYKMIGVFPCCAIIPGTIEIAPRGTAHTYEFIYNGEVGVYTKDIKRHDAYYYQWDLTQIIWEILASPEYETFEIDGHKIYSFNIFQGIRQGVVEGGAVRASLIAFQAREWKTVLC